MLGTLINVATVTVGSLCGMGLKSALPERMITTTFHILGIFTLILGFQSAFNTNNALVMLISVLVGGIIGEALRLQKRIESLAKSFQAKGNENPDFTQGLITAFMIFCVGALTVIGCFDEGIRGDRKLIVTKSIMDLFSSTALASAFGKGVLFSAVPLLLYQGGLTLGAAQLAPYLNEAMQIEIGAAGGLMLIALGFNILKITEIRVINLLPGLILVLILTHFAQEFGFYNLDELLK